MPTATFLASVETALKAGNATEHTYRPALKTLFEAVIAGSTTTNEPQHAAYGAPDFLIQQGNVPLGHVEAKDIGVTLRKSIDDSARNLPKTQNGKQLKRYRAALPNLLYTDGLEWHWFVEGEPRLDAPICIATWDKGKKKLHPSTSAAHDLTTLLEQFAAHRAALVGTPNDLAKHLAQVARWLDEVINTVLQDEQQHGSLHQQLAAFRQTLLPTITPPEFADMYAQTLVYGLFAARVAAPDRPTFTRYDAAQAVPKTNPFLRKMFQQIAGYDLDERIAWLVDDCARLLVGLQRHPRDELRAALRFSEEQGIDNQTAVRLKHELAEEFRSQLVTGTRTLDDLRYATPRHTLVSGVVGHGDSADSPTHLMALNLDGQVVVLEVPGGDAEQVRVLAGPYLFGEDGAYEVPRLALHDMDGDGTDDLVVTVKGELVVYLNKEGTFRLPSSEERAVLEEVRDGRD